MDHKTYRTKILIFQEAFSSLEIMMEADSVERVKDNPLALAAKIRNLLSQGNSTIPDIGMLLPIESIQTLKDFNLLADLETVARQAEAVKQEIIEISNKYKLKSSYVYVDGCLDVCRNIDFIRDPSGNIVEPFDFWTDCIEVYIRKYLLKHSNGQIARDYIFKSSDSKTDRARLQLIKNMLDETSRILSAIHNFPPRTLSCGKQPV